MRNEEAEGWEDSEDARGHRFRGKDPCWVIQKTKHWLLYLRKASAPGCLEKLGPGSPGFFWTLSVTKGSGS